MCYVYDKQIVLEGVVIIRRRFKGFREKKLIPYVKYAEVQMTPNYNHNDTVSILSRLLFCVMYALPGNRMAYVCSIR